MVKIFIIIVNWNGKQNTIECLDSISRLTQDLIKVETIVVDNGSTDGSQETISLKFPNVYTLFLKKNTGFTGGNNLGIQYALKRYADFIWLLNNDTILDKTTLMKLLKAMSDVTVGIVGPKIYFSSGREFHKRRYKENDRGKVLWYAGGIIDWKNVYAYHRGVDEVDIGRYDQTEETEFVSGCSMFIRRSVLEKVGLLDDKYYLYLEDLDFSVRAKRLGVKLLYVGDAFLWHKNAASTDRPGNNLHEYYFTRNQLLFGSRYASLRSKIALLRQAIRFVINGPVIKRQAVLDALMNRFGEGELWRH